MDSEFASKSGDLAEDEISRREYWWSLGAAIILSLATLASAWCGYQASAWNSTYSHEAREANGARFEAARQSGISDRQIISDLLIYSTWLEAEVTENTSLATEIETRFQPHFVPAFEAWSKLPVPDGAHVPNGTPFDRPEYQLPTSAAAELANQRAEEALAAADRASEASSRYVLNTVLFASVLFLAGIASKLRHPRISHAVIAVAGVMLVWALWLLVTSPRLLSAI